LGVPAGFILVYCPGLAAVLLTQDAVRNGLASFNLQGQTYACAQAAQQQLRAGESLIMQGPGEYRISLLIPIREGGVSVCGVVVVTLSLLPCLACVVGGIARNITTNSEGVITDLEPLLVLTTASASDQTTSVFNRTKSVQGIGITVGAGDVVSDTSSSSSSSSSSGSSNSSTNEATPTTSASPTPKTTKAATTRPSSILEDLGSMKDSSQNTADLSATTPRARPRTLSWVVVAVVNILALAAACLH